MSNVQNIIEREAATDPGILGIDVFDDQAEVLFSTQDGALERQILGGLARRDRLGRRRRLAGERS